MPKRNLSSHAHRAKVKIRSGWETSSSSSEESGNKKRSTEASSRRVGQRQSQPSDQSVVSLAQLDEELSDEDIVNFLDLITGEEDSDDASMPSWEDPVSVFFSVTKPEIETDVYIRRLVRYAQCSRAAFVIGMVYLRRLEKFNSKLAITPYNMHRLLITSLMIAAKNIDDRCYSNAHYARVGGIATVKEVNRLELQMLALLRYNIYVSREEFYYFVEHLQEGDLPELCTRMARLHEAFPREMQRSCAIGTPPNVCVPKLRIRRVCNLSSSSLIHDVESLSEYSIDEPSEELRVLPIHNTEKKLSVR